MQMMKNNVIDEIEKRNEYRDLISDNIEYNFIIKSYGQSFADEIREIMLDAVCSRKEYLWISEEHMRFQSGKQGAKIPE